MLSDINAKFYSYCLLYQFVIDMLTTGFLSKGEKRKKKFLYCQLLEGESESVIPSMLPLQMHTTVKSPLNTTDKTPVIK